MKYSGTIVRGIKAPIIKSGDDICEIVVKSLADAANESEFKLNDKDVVAVTESIVARAQGNYATIDNIASDVSEKFPQGVVGLILPILSRNRFSLLLKGISQGVKKLIVQLSYPQDEVGNPLMDIIALEEKGINPYSDIFTYEEFRKIFPSTKHPFTNLDYIEYYKEIGNCEIIMANNPLAILSYTDQVIVANIHNRKHYKNILLKNGAKTVYGLDEILNTSINGSGYHEQYGLLGSNLSDDNTIKLFPRNCDKLVRNIQNILKEKYHKEIEVMVYGDGAFKDPKGGIWELADPVVAVGYTKGLEGTPHELKLKYLADNQLKGLQGEEAKKAMKQIIKDKNSQTESNITLGTTPRQITDLLGSLADLTSGSGDKGTPIVLIQNYFVNYSDE